MSADATAPAPPPRARSEERTAAPQPSAAPEGSRRNLLAYFPLGYREAAQQWWCSISATTAERGVLAHVPYLREAHLGSEPDLRLPRHPRVDEALPETDGAVPTTATTTTTPPPQDDPYGPRLWRSQMVPLSGKNRALNEYSVERVGEDATDTLVMLHGYGAGLGFFYRNFEPLTRARGWRLFALDMLGMGNSSRPAFNVHAKDAEAKTAEAEAWFVDALEEWRRARNIERFTLLGHSLGGYLAVSYALKYPGRLNKLILASPVGIPEDPYAVSGDAPAPDASALAAALAQDQEAVVNDTAGTAAADTAAAPTSNHNYRYNHNHRPSGAPGSKPERRPLPGWLVWLWDANVSPFSVVRASGPLGPRLVSGWTSRRFSHLPPAEADALHTYTYSLFRQRGSGEYALPYLLAPGAYARRPVINRIQDVGRQPIPPAVAAATSAATGAAPATREFGYPIVMMYGDHDWMDVAGGYAAQEKIKRRIEHTLLHGTPEEQRHENGSAKVVLIRNAGHHLYLDNPTDFNEAIREELQDTQESEQRRRQQGGA